MFNRVAVSNALVAALIFMAAPAQAVVEAGKIIYSRGVVSIVDIQDSARGGKSGAKIFEGDRVVTGRGGIAQIRLSDGALIALRGSSEYQIEKQTFGNDEGVYEQAGKLFTGWMRSITGAIGQKYPQKVTQRTSVATIGIRGTVYQVISIPPEGLPGFAGEAPGTYVFLEEGSVELKGNDGARLLKPGEVVFVPESGGAPVLMPGKKPLFLNAEEGVVEFVEAENLEFGQDLNQTLTSNLGGSRTPGFVGYFQVYSFTGQYVTAPGSVEVAGFGVGRIPTRLTIDDGEVFYEVVPNASATPTQMGAYLSDSGALINWGVWGSNNYSVYDNGTLSNTVPFSEWHFMLADNLLASPEDLDASRLSGTASYSYVGGTTLTDQIGTSGLSVNITGGKIDVNFNTQTMLFNIDSTAGALTYDAAAGGGNTISDFYNGGIALTASGSGYAGGISGAFADQGDAIVSKIYLDDGNGAAEGVAAFAR
ncbi:MAG: FecR family protein [Alcanivoracaceae bacterium]|nr:FecR family protein [Alcanivoracaceae bacterium]